jgi:Holliday junction resolvase-like predicted endonuclease
MDQFEEAVLGYISAVPGRFVSYQMNILYDGKHGGSCPDFVVLDFNRKTIYVVEVTSSADTKRLLERIREREARWLKPLTSLFDSFKPTFDKWDYRITIFVRDEEAEAARKAISEFKDVSVISLDKVIFSWRWNWVGPYPVNPLD